MITVHNAYGRVVCQAMFVICYFSQFFSHGPAFLFKPFVCVLAAVYVSKGQL